MMRWFLCIVSLLLVSPAVFAINPENKYPQPQWKWGEGQPVMVFFEERDVKLLENLGIRFEWVGERSGLAFLKRDEVSLLIESGLSYQLITRNDAWRILHTPEKEEYPNIVWLDYPSYDSPGQNIPVSINFTAHLPPGVGSMEIIIWRRTTETDFSLEFVTSQDIEVSSPNVDTTVSLSYPLPDSFFYVHEYWIGVGYSHFGSNYYTWFSYYINMPPEPIHQNVAMIVDEDVYNNIESAILQYKTDVESNFDAELHTYIALNEYTPEDIRNYLQFLYYDSSITGAILVGLLPYAMWEPVWDEPPFPIPYFYEDLDGEFIDGDGDGYYECHEWGENPEPEIWVFWMRPPQNNPLALSDFLQKCHSYYELNLHIPMQALECVNYDWRGSSKPFYINLSHIYGEAVDTIGGDEWRVSGSEYLDYLSTYGSEITHIWCHSGSDVHCFDRSPWVYWYNIRDIQPGSWFYLLWACHGANFEDHPSHNLAINYCMGESSGLASLGVVRSIGTGNAQETFFNSLAYGKSLGEAYFDYMCYNYDSTWVRIWFGYGEDAVPPDSFVWDFCFIGNPFVTFPGSLEGSPSPPKNLTASPRYLEIDLLWKANYEADIAGYNVYRGKASGGPYERLNTSLISDTTYTDTALEGIWYYYAVTAVDTQDLESNYSLEVPARPISLDHGILVVDETRNGTGAPGSPNDAQVDGFYRAILSGYDFTEWDVDSLGKPSIYDLGPYSPIIWHGDDYASQELSSVIPGIKRYLDEGGKLWLCGWRPILAIIGSGTYPFTFSEGDFPYDYLKLLNANESTSNDFISAWGGPAISAYPDISVDSTKVPLSWVGRMKYVDVFTPLDSKHPTGCTPLDSTNGVKALAFYRTGVHQLADACSGKPLHSKNTVECPDGKSGQYHAEPIYFFNSASGDTTFQDKPCGIRYLGADYKLIFFGFPLYFMKEDEAAMVAQKVLSDLEVGVEETTLIPKVFALYQNYPNPFSRETDIRFQIPDCSKVSLKIYDVSGRLVRTLIDGYGSPGRHTVSWDGRDETGNKLGAGVYFVKFKSDRFTNTRKIVLLR